MTLSTSETRSRNWACPEVTSSPMKVLVGRRQKWRRQGHEMQPGRVRPVCEGAEDATSGKQSTLDHEGAPPSPGRLTFLLRASAFRPPSPVWKPSFLDSDHTPPQGLITLEGALPSFTAKSTDPKPLRPSLRHRPGVWPLLEDLALQHWLHSCRRSPMLSLIFSF